MTVVTSETELCNIALTRLGHQQISSLDEASKAGRLCNLHYGPTRDSVLRAHPWNFAVKRVTLSLDVPTPNHEYTYQHSLPSDFLRIVRTHYEAEGYASADYRIEGLKLVSDDSTVKIEYIAKITDVSQFDALFVDVLAQRLAAEMAVALTDNQAATKTLWEIYDVKLREARTIDAQEGRPRDFEAYDWLDARY